MTLIAYFNCCLNLLLIEKIITMATINPLIKTTTTVISAIMVVLFVELGQLQLLAAIENKILLYLLKTALQ